MRERLKILVAGSLAAAPHQAGAGWAVLQYVLGFQSLGHDVHLVEPLPAAAVTPKGCDVARSDNAAFFLDVVRETGLQGRASLLVDGERQCVGTSYETLLDAATSADILVNISGMLTDAALLEPIPRRVYLDLDPGFVQLWHEAEGIDMRFEGHTHFITVGVNIGTSICPVPTGDRTWSTTLPPVDLTRWPPAERIHHDAFTTVGNWRGYGSLHHGGLHYGQRCHSLRSLVTLPRLVPHRFILALNIHPDEREDLEALADNGWTVVDPLEVAGSLWGYRDFIAGSTAELSVAKSGYVVSSTGWFSDRSACYLASGRPVVAQDTGMATSLPLGAGLLVYRDVEEAAAAVETVQGAYAVHSRAARELAEDLLDAKKVISRLIDIVDARA